MPKQMAAARRKQPRPRIPLRALWVPVAAFLGAGAIALALRGDTGPAGGAPSARSERTEPKVLAIQTEPVPIAKQMEGQTGVVRVVMTDQGFEPAVLTAQIGSPVKIYLRNESSQAQNFLLPRFGVVASSLGTGGENYIEFTAGAKGEWEFFSDQGQEGTLRMAGILKVE